MKDRSGILTPRRRLVAGGQFLDSVGTLRSCQTPEN